MEEKMAKYFGHKPTWKWKDPPRDVPPPQMNDLPPYPSPAMQQKYGVPAGKPSNDLRWSGRSGIATEVPGKQWKTIEHNPFEFDPINSASTEFQAYAKQSQAIKRAMKNLIWKTVNPLGKIANFVSISGQVLDYLDPALQGKTGYDWPETPHIHWGPYDCGVTPYIGFRTDNGYLTETTFACLPGQVMQGASAVEAPGTYGSTFNMPARKNYRSMTIGRWNGSTRFTVIEHFYWNTPRSHPANTKLEYKTAKVLPNMPLSPPQPLISIRSQPRAAKKPPYVPPYLKLDNGGVNIAFERPKDKKWKLGKGGVLGNIYGGLTEIKDGYKCAEKATKGYRSKKGVGLHDHLQDLALYIYNKPASFNPAGFISCMVENHFQDKVIGKANQLANRITKHQYWVRPTGVSSGSWSRRI